MKEIIFKLWDNKQKVYFENSFTRLVDAQEYKDTFLGNGNYPDESHDVISIFEFTDGVNTGDMTYIYGI